MLQSALTAFFEPELEEDGALRVEKVLTHRTSDDALHDAAELAYKYWFATGRGVASSSPCSSSLGAAAAAAGRWGGKKGGSKKARAKAAAEAANANANALGGRAEVGSLYVEWFTSSLSRRQQRSCLRRYVPGEERRRTLRQSLRKQSGGKNPTATVAVAAASSASSAASSVEAAAAQPLVQEPLSFLQELESYPSNATRERFQFLVKFKGRSFLHLQWLDALDLEAMSKRARAALSRYLNWLAKQVNVPHFNPDSIAFDGASVALEVDRVLDCRDVDVEQDDSDAQLLLLNATAAKTEGAAAEGTAENKDSEFAADATTVAAASAADESCGGGKSIDQLRRQQLGGGDDDDDDDDDDAEMVFEE
jgi:hypothetical protein